MIPSERIRAITAISDHFIGEEWSVIDLVLDQFGFPTRSEWGGSEKSYIIDIIKSASDEELSELAQYVGFEAAVNKVQLNTDFWGQGHFKLFISHLSEHQAYAGMLQSALKEYGISCFVAHKDAHPTTEWQAEIEAALHTCDALIALLHPGFHESRWTDQEIGFVMGRKKPSFTVRLGEDPYGFIGRFQAFYGIEKSADELSVEIFSALIKNKETQQNLALHLAHALENSGSFASSVELVTHLEHVQTAPSSTQAVVLRALKENSQVYGEGKYNVPKRVRSLLAKWSQ